jgi:hypothetical protein
LLDGSASIYDEVVCRCTKEPRRGQGCDSIDNNCDKTVDECQEDAFVPEIDISDASLNCASGNGKTKWFTAEADALSCVSTYAAVVDDCDTKVSFDDPVLEETCDKATINLTASDRCGNDAEFAIVPVFIDEEVPTVSCSLGDDEEQVIYVPDTGAGVMTNVNLVYDATDNCGFDMDVQVNVFANEIEDFHNQETAIFFRNGMSHNRAGLYVAAQFCVTDANGQCIKDPKLDTRVYTIVVSASDEAGNAVVPAVCQVVIVPEGKVAASLAGKGKPLDIGVSTQRFRRPLSTPRVSHCAITNSDDNEPTAASSCMYLFLLVLFGTFLFCVPAYNKTIHEFAWGVNRDFTILLLRPSLLRMSDGVLNFSNVLAGINQREPVTFIVPVVFVIFFAVVLSSRVTTVDLMLSFCCIVGSLC